MAKRSTYKKMASSVKKAAKSVARKAKKVVKKVMPARLFEGQQTHTHPLRPSVASLEARSA